MVMGKGYLTTFSFVGILIVGMLAGCASAPPIKHMPPVFSDMTMQSVPATQPLRLGEWPTAELVATEQSEYLCFDRGGAMQLFTLREAAQANTEIADALAGQVDALQAQRGALIEVGRLCEQRNKVLVEALNEAREEHTWQLLGRDAVIGALLLILIL